MIGAIFGDIVGSSYEFSNTNKYNFDLLTAASSYTDDSVITLAVAKALVVSYGKSDDEIRDSLIDCMKELGQKYPSAGYGGMFCRWVLGDSREPYNSYGNGSAMRVSPAGWLYDSMQETRHAARLSAEVTHNHPEGIKGAEATAAAVYMARCGRTKDEIRQYIESEFGYDLDKKLKDVVSKGHGQEICQITVPQSLVCFLLSNSFTDAIRKAVSIGGDSDTIACITGGIAEAYYGFPAGYDSVIDRYLGDQMKAIISQFNEFKRERKTGSREDTAEENVRAPEAIDMDTYIRRYRRKRRLFGG